jgi:hypothetical protein
MQLHPTAEINASEIVDAEPRPMPSSLPEHRLRGLGGWLVLVGLGLVGTPCRTLVALGQQLDAIGQLEGLPQFYRAALAEATISATLGIALPILILALFFKRKRLFPAVYIFWLWSGPIYWAVDAFYIEHLLEGFQHTSTLPESLIGTVMLGTGALIWTLYIRMSKRVSATFVEN